MAGDGACRGRAVGPARVGTPVSCLASQVPPARRVCDPDRVCRECLRSAYVEKECGYMMDVSAFTLLPTRLTRMTSIVHFAPKVHHREGWLHA